MRRIITTFIIILASCCINMVHATGPDDFVIVQTKAFVNDGSYEK